VNSKSRHAPRQARNHNRSAAAQATARPPSRFATSGCRPATTRSTAATPPDREAWQRETKALRNVILLLGFTLLTLVVRMVIDGSSLLGAVTAALISALLLGSLRLRQHAQRQRPGSDPDNVSVRDGEQENESDETNTSTSNESGFPS
jgi:Flp pilus assembly protein TadB